MSHFSVAARNETPHEFCGNHARNWREVRWILRNAHQWMRPGYVVQVQRVPRRRIEKLSRTMGRIGMQALRKGVGA